MVQFSFILETKFGIWHTYSGTQILIDLKLNVQLRIERDTTNDESYM